MKSRCLELLSPAANGEIARQAIIHGADAVYIGASSHGARKKASNTISEIEEVVDFAHKFRAKVYVTVNTLIYEDELKKVENLCRDLYHVGVDALIVQDMSLLRMALPPIALHASTQCDIRTPEKAKFLESVGFSQLVLARELTLEEIKKITESVTVPVECFVHGALCVCYSGRCQASLALTGRSGNRGECAQICRLPFTLTDRKGNIIEKNRFLLSLKDFNASESIEKLIEAGVTSFKIEGRLKDNAYVRNITAYYSQKLNEIIRGKGNEYRRSSSGVVTYKFTPNPEKSFNRGFTDYFLSSRRPESLSSMFTPKSLGEKITTLSELHNGDGISFFDRDKNFTGVNINRIENNRIIPSRRVQIPANATLYRTSDVEWEKLMDKETAVRKIGVKITIDGKGVTAEDERGCRVRLPLNLIAQTTDKTIDYQTVFEKLGGTDFILKGFKSELGEGQFYRFSELAALRRQLISELESCNRATYPYDYRRKEQKEALYPLQKLDSRDNISNSNSEKFYKSHGVSEIERAAEVTGGKESKGKIIMTTRHCILRELGMCRKEGGKGKFPPEELYLYGGNRRLRLEFNCKDCEMNVIC